MNLRPEATPAPAHILIVDDERHNRVLLDVILAPEGFHVRTAASGHEALAMVAEEPPDLILLDVMMPGMDGHEVAANLKTDVATAHIPIIMVTALADRETMMRALDVGAEDFLSKPVDRAELCLRVRNLLRLKAHGDYYDKYSQRLEDEAAARISQMRFKDEFLSHVSHELRSPLTAIKQFTTILLGGLAGELNAEQHEYQAIVLKNVQQLQSMIDDLLEGTRLENGKVSVELGRVSVADAVSDAVHTVQLTARSKGITVSCEVPQDLPPARADQTRLRQILIILLDNAVKFSAGGDVVTVTARQVPGDVHALLIEVSDTGCGIAPNAADRIFERLYQVAAPAAGSRKGLGLGLYICKELVTRLGGRIWVDSQPRKGSTFSFTLPEFSADDWVTPLPGGSPPPAEPQPLASHSVNGESLQ